MQALAAGHGAELALRPQGCHALGCCGCAAEIEGGLIAGTGQGRAVGRREKNHLRRYGREGHKKLRFGHHPEGALRPQSLQAQQQGKGEQQIPHAVELKDEDGVRVHVMGPGGGAGVAS